MNQFGGKGKKGKLNTNLHSYIKKILSYVTTEIGIKEHSLDIINTMLIDLSKKIIQGASSLTNLNNKKTISGREIQSSVRIVLPGELAKHAISEGIKAITKLETTRERNNKNDKKMSRTKQAGLSISISRVENMIKAWSQRNSRIGSLAACYLSAVLDYITAEIVELASNASRDRWYDRGREQDYPNQPEMPKDDDIYPNHIMLAIRNDMELNNNLLVALLLLLLLQEL